MEQTLGKRIAENRKRLGLTQDQLAEKLGVTAQAVSKWENEQSCPDISILPQLADIFCVSTDVLLGREPLATSHAAYQSEPIAVEENKTNNLEFSYSSGRRTGLGMALLVLAAGGQLLAARLLQRDLGFWSILWTTTLVVFGCFGVYPKFSFFRLGCLLFGGCSLLDYWQVLPISLGSELLLPTLLILLGLSLLIDALRKKGKPCWHFSRKRKKNKKSDAGKDLEMRENSFSFLASFGDVQQPISLPLLANGEIHVSFGDYVVDLCGIEAVSESCTMETNCSFGKLTLLVPRRFAVQPRTSTAFADISMTGHPDPQPQGIISLEANANFGTISIQHI